jgi:hypothetical protein
MSMISRRHSFQATMASILMLAAPNVAFPQGALSALKAIFEGVKLIGDALAVSELIDKWSHDQRCDVALSDLETLESQCGLIATLINSEDIGAIPRLKAFLDKQDEQNWHRVKVALGVLLDSGSVLISSVSAVAEKLNEKTYPGAYEKISELKRAYSRIQGSIRALASLPDKPESDIIKVMASILEEVSRLPRLAENAAQQLRLAKEERLKLKC